VIVGGGIAGAVNNALKQFSSSMLLCASATRLAPRHDHR
jgi:hypothetical protein